MERAFLHFIRSTMLHVDLYTCALLRLVGSIYPCTHVKICIPSQYVREGTVFIYVAIVYLWLLAELTFVKPFAFVTKINSQDCRSDI